MKEKSAFAALGICLVLLVLSSCSSSPELKDSVRAYEDAYNSHNLEEVVSQFTNNPTFEIKGQFILKGKQALRDLVAYDIALDIHMSIGNMKTAGDTVYAHLTETNNWLQVAGIGEAHYLIEFVFRDGAIEREVGTPTPETETAFQDVLRPLMAWAEREAPDRLEEMMPNGEFEYTAENAERTLALLEDWRRSVDEEQDTAGE